MAKGFKHNINKYFSIDPTEIRQLLITAVVGGFCLSFRRWGADDVLQVAFGFYNLFLGIIFVAIGLTIMVVVQKLVAIHLGMTVTYQFWKLGLIFGVMITFLTNGWIPLFFPGSLDGIAVAKMRVGKYEARFKHWEFALANLGGVLGMLLFILVLLRPLYFFIPIEFFRFFILCILAIMVFAMIPLPLFHGIRVIESGRTAYDFNGGTVGFNIFYGQRFLYWFVASFTVLFAFLILAAGFFSFFLAVIVGLILGAFMHTQMNKGVF